MKFNNKLIIKTELCNQATIELKNLKKMNAETKQGNYTPESKIIVNVIVKENRIDHKIKEPSISTGQRSEQGKPEQIKNTGKYVCDHCSMQFVYKEEVFYHIRRHFIYKPYVCQVCKKCFLKQDKFRWHIKKCHQCPQCNGCFLSEEEVQLHITKMHSQKSSRCIPCDKVFSQTELLQHKALHKRCNQCPTCNGCFLSEKGVQMHLAKMHSLETTRSLPCDKVFSNSIMIQNGNHIDQKIEEATTGQSSKQGTHEQIKDTSKYVCDHCSKHFEYKREVTEHITSHFNYKPYVCQVCKKGFLRHHKFRLHIKICHLCPECNGCFLSEKEVQLHITKMHSQKSTRCIPCGKLFSLTEYKQHKALHKAQHNTCSVCNRYFPDKFKLHRHEKVHKRDFKFSCKICKKPFRNLRSLNTHMFNCHMPCDQKTEQNKCYECGKSFEKYMSLYQHLKIHYEKQFICDKCGEKFTHQHQLNNHMTSHSEVRNHVCDTCGAKFKMPHHLRNHQKTHI